MWSMEPISPSSPAATITIDPRPRLLLPNPALDYPAAKTGMGIGWKAGCGMIELPEIEPGPDPAFTSGPPVSVRPRLRDPHLSSPH